MSAAPARLYTLGPEGTFSDKAAQRLRASLAAGGRSAPTVSYTRTIPEVLDRTEADPESLGVFPIENSDTGTVVFAQDALVAHRVTIVLEINVRVRFSLLANAPLETVPVLYSQPVAYDQCGSYLARHLPLAQVSFTNSNTESGLRLLEAGEDAPCAAIVPAEFAEEHAAQRVAEDIQNYANNTTRFLAVRAAGRESGGKVDHDFTRAKTSILIEPEEDRPGLLYDLLSVFKTHDLNLCRLESRPAKVRPWTYVFFLDFNNNAETAQALAELDTGARRITVLGSYDILE
jgi:prephenate dehydratase